VFQIHYVMSTSGAYPGGGDWGTNPPVNGKISEKIPKIPPLPKFFLYKNFEKPPRKIPGYAAGLRKTYVKISIFKNFLSNF